MSHNFGPRIDVLPQVRVAEAWWSSSHLRRTCCKNPAGRRPRVGPARRRRTSHWRSAHRPSHGGRPEPHTASLGSHPAWDTTLWPKRVRQRTAPCPSGLGGEASTRTCSGKRHRQREGYHWGLLGRRVATKYKVPLTCAVSAEAPPLWCHIGTLWKRLTAALEANTSPSHWEAQTFLLEQETKIKLLNTTPLLVFSLNRLSYKYLNTSHKKSQFSHLFKVSCFN